MDQRYLSNFLYFQEEGHKYTDSNGNPYTSVTTLIHDNYCPTFDKKYWLRKKSKELGITEKALAKQWQDITDEACARGSVTHNGIEDAIKEVSKFKKAIKYLTDVESGRCITLADIPQMIPKPLDVDQFIKATDNKYPEIYRVFKYYTDKGYIIYSEIGAFLMDYLISGTIDIFCYRPTDFVILDWKTNRQGLIFESGYYKKDKTTIPAQLTDVWVRKDDKMLPPLNVLPDCNGSHYTMQLSMYAKMAELILQIPCTGLGLCHIGSPWILNNYGQPYRDTKGYHLDPNGKETVKWFRIEYQRKLAEAVLNDRLAQVKANNIKIKKEELNLFN